MIDEQMKLFAIQVDLENSYSAQIRSLDGLPKIQGSSVEETIMTCLLLKENTVAQRCKTNFKISDSHFACMKAKAASTMGDWPELAQIASKLRRSRNRGPATADWYANYLINTVCSIQLFRQR